MIFKIWWNEFLFNLKVYQKSCAPCARELTIWNEFRWNSKIQISNLNSVIYLWTLQVFIPIPAFFVWLFKVQNFKLTDFFWKLGFLIKIKKISRFYDCWKFSTIQFEEWCGLWVIFIIYVSSEHISITANNIDLHR